MEQKYNSISFCYGDYSDRADDKNDVKAITDEIFADITTALRILLKNDYQCKVWYDGYTYVIEYNYADEGLGGTSLEWIGGDEYVEKYGNPGAAAEEE